MGLKRDILIGLGVVGVILLIIAVLVGIVVLLVKALGILIILGGIFLIIFFPDIEDFQPLGMSKTGIVLGIILLIAGVWFILA
jgi:hypothetical protein